MRIAFFHHSLILGSGIDTGIYELARRIGRKHDVTVLTFRSDYESVEPAALRIIQTAFVSSAGMALYGPFDPRAWVESRRFLRTQDAVNVHTYPANLLGYRVSGVFHVATEWGAVDPSMFPRVRQRAYIRIATRAEAAYARSADLVLTPCPFTARWVVEHFGVEPETMFLDGINFDVFDREAVNPSPIYERYPSFRPGPVLLFVGRIAPSRNLETLIDAMVILRRQFPTVVLAITGKESDPAYARRLREQVMRLQLGSTVFFTGVASWEDLARLYKACDVYVSPSLWEGFLRAEAFAMGKPMVAFDAAANPDTIRHGENGLLVSGRTAEDLATALMTLLNDPPTARRMGQAGFAWARDNLNFDRIAQMFTDLLENRVNKG